MSRGFEGVAHLAVSDEKSALRVDEQVLTLILRIALLIQRKGTFPTVVSYVK